MAMPSDETPVDAAEAGELRLLIREEEAIAFVKNRL